MFVLNDYFELIWAFKICLSQMCKTHVSKHLEAAWIHVVLLLDSYTDISGAAIRIFWEGYTDIVTYGQSLWRLFIQTAARQRDVQGPRRALRGSRITKKKRGRRGSKTRGQLGKRTCGETFLFAAPHITFNISCSTSTLCLIWGRFPQVYLPFPDYMGPWNLSKYPRKMLFPSA